jgi:ectoine hydroxylase-related dioxygenase (phytanoyl-CoA dioxygenase family)
MFAAHIARMEASMKLTSAELEQFTNNGYVVVEGAVEPHLLEPLRAAAARVTGKTRSGEWPHNGDAGDGDIWGVNHLLHPDLSEPVFAQWLASDPVLDIAAQLLSPSLRLFLVAMFVDPAKRDFAFGWHRDGLRRELPPEEELAILARPQDSVQWNTALYDEACFLVVPGSHRRAATAEERDIQFRRPMEAMPDEITVPLQAGQAVYYHAQLLHRNLNPAGRRRATLHAILHRHPSDEALPFHYQFVNWLETPAVRDTLPPRLHPLFDNWLAVAEEVKRQEASGG